MTIPLWSSVEAYLVERLVPDDPAMFESLAATQAAGMPSISVAPTEGRLLHLLARTCGATRILEIGTLGAYSTIWLARALPRGGEVVTLEISEAYAAVARANLERAGVSDLVDIRVGPAIGMLERLIAERAKAFDFVFIDADKENSLPYFECAIELSRPGALIVVDNVVREGKVADESKQSADILGIRRLLDRLAGEPRVDATVIQTVGSKGHDGMLIARVR